MTAPALTRADLSALTAPVTLHCLSYRVGGQAHVEQTRIVAEHDDRVRVLSARGIQVTAWTEDTPAR